MKITTPLATLFAAHIEENEVAVFSHRFEPLAHLFQTVGFQIEIKRLFCHRFRTFVWIAKVENDDFTLVRWAIEAIRDKGFNLSDQSRTLAFTTKLPDKQSRWYELLSDLEISRYSQNLQKFVNRLDIARIEAGEIGTHYSVPGQGIQYRRDEQNKAIRYFIAESGLLLFQTRAEREDTARHTRPENWQNIKDVPTLRAVLTHLYRTEQDALTNMFFLHVCQQMKGEEIIQPYNFPPVVLKLPWIR